MWLYVVIGALLLLVVALYPLQGWITYVVKQRRRELKYKVTAAPARPQPRDWRNDEVTLAWLGHSTLLMNLHGRWVLTDPVLGESVGIHLPFGISFGPRRLVGCALTPEELPPIDLIVQSHAHMDHLDTRSWRKLKHGPAVVMAARNGRFIRHLGFEPVYELSWGQSVECDDTRVTAVEVNHWGERFPWSCGLGYNAYLLERNGTTILFGGDTAYTTAFRRACAGRTIDVAVLPIGGYQPYIHVHASPEQAWQMFCETGARYLVPIHHQTFILSREHPAEPLQRLLQAAGDQADRVVLRQVGETFIIPAHDRVSTHPNRI